MPIIKFVCDFNENVFEMLTRHFEYFVNKYIYIYILEMTISLFKQEIHSTSIINQIYQYINIIKVVLIKLWYDTPMY